MQKQNNIPQLRFPEFKNEWERKPLVELSENGFSNGAFNDPRKVGSGYRIINVKDMYVDGTINADNLTRVAIDEKEFLKNRVEFGDIFFTRSSLVKEGIAYSNVNLNDAEDLTFDGHLIRMRPKNEKCSPVFLYYNFATSNARIQFIQRGKTTTMTTIGQEDIATVEIILPTLPEQKKIASFITAIDKKISELKQKKNLLEQYKKGVMQKIFSQELRFKDDKGKDFPKWEKKKLGDVAEVKRGAASQHLKYVSNETKGIRLLRINDFLNNDAVYVEDTADIKRFRVKTNDLLIAGTGATAGIIFIVPEKFNNMSFSYNAPRIRVTNAYHTFIYYYLKSDIILQEQQRLFVGNAQPFLDTDSMRGFKINLPSLPEQIKIANIISSIEAKINCTQMQIEKTEEYKKGLLQNMFC